MALHDMDSFDYYQTPQLGLVYDAADPGLGVGGGPANQIEVGTGACGTNCLHIESFPGNYGVRRGIQTTATTFVWGIRLKVTAATVAIPIFGLNSGIIPTFALTIGLDGSLQGVYNPDSAFPPVSFTSTGGLIPFGTWTYLEFSIFMSPTPGDPGTGAGVVKIYINGILRQTLTGLQTCWSIDNPVPTGFSMGGSQFQTHVRYDDMYFLDNLGPAPWNAALGDKHVERLRPVGPGALTQFALTGAPTNWQAQDKGDTPNTSAFVRGTAVGVTDTYVCGDIVSSPLPIITGVKMSALTEKDSVGTRSIEFLKRRAGVNYPTGVQLGLSTIDFRYVKTILMNDPATGAAWVGQGSVNGSAGNEFGLKVST